jgi:hypothetical protein
MQATRAREGSRFRVDGMFARGASASPAVGSAGDDADTCSDSPDFSSSSVEVLPPLSPRNRTRGDHRAPVFVALLSCRFA